MTELHSLLPNLVHLGAMLYLVCFLFKNQMMLRAFAIMGDLAYTGFYWKVADEPLYTAMAYSTLNMVINIYMILQLLSDQRQSHLNDNELKLYQGFNGMSPGDFRKLTKLGVWNKTDESIELTKEGEAVNHLHYVLDGDIAMTKSGRPIVVSPGIFIGEIAYLRGTPASATVKLKPGATYISWPHDALQKLTTQHEGLRQSLTNVLSGDLAAKLARS